MRATWPPNSHHSSFTPQQQESHVMSNEITQLIEEQGRQIEKSQKNHAASLAAMEARLAEQERQVRDLETKAGGLGGMSWSSTGPSEMEAFADFLRSDETKKMTFEPSARKAMSIGTDSAGGYLTPLGVVGQLDSVMTRFNPFRRLVKIQPVSNDKPELLIGQADAAAAWVGEVAARPATTTPTIAAITPSMGELYANLPASQRLIDDSSTDIARWVVEEAGRQFGLSESASIVSGSGTNQPKGFLTATLSATPTWGQIKQVKSASAGAVTADTLLDLVFSLPAAYRQNAAFVAAPTAIAAIRKLKDSQARPLWEPGLGTATPPTLYGYPVYESEDMPVLAASANCIAFADWSRAYVLADRQVSTVLVDPFTAKPYVNYYCRRRVGGCLYDSQAIAIYTTGV
jgi:HK97 family phage major capsid protein